MSKKIKRCNNEELRECLRERDEIYRSIQLEEHNFSDEEEAIFKRVSLLQPFERDLLYLSSKMSVKEIAKVYVVSTTHLYNQLHNIQKKLKGEC